MPNNDEKKVLLKVTDLKQWFPLKKKVIPERAGVCKSQ